ncbi:MULTISPECIES: hypothetical protein [Cycloclasticus]|uniref:hypothetical protein n=1 Tax=Cycloclasticus TaxID=34067 RepID=UPI000922C559|nr:MULTISPECIES: hypothetical protein [Cycloclasticus]SHI64111.1 hypothetical protein SAMN05519226_0697 [Cycloclasticus pugetii]
MRANKKAVSRFAYMMVVLSVVAVLLGVGVFYWFVFDEVGASSDGAKRPSLSSPSNRN